MWKIKKIFWMKHKNIILFLDNHKEESYYKKYNIYEMEYRGYYK